MQNKVCQDKCPAFVHWAASQLLPVGVLPPLYNSHVVKMWPLYHFIPIKLSLEYKCKKVYHSRLGKLPGFTSTTRKIFKSQINDMVQGNTVGWLRWSWPMWTYRQPSAQGLHWYADVTFWWGQEQSHLSQCKQWTCGGSSVWSQSAQHRQITPRGFTSTNSEALLFGHKK